MHRTLYYSGGKNPKQTKRPCSHGADILGNVVYFIHELSMIRIVYQMVISAKKEKLSRQGTTSVPVGWWTGYTFNLNTDGLRLAIFARYDGAKAVGIW